MKSGGLNFLPGGRRIAFRRIESSDLQDIRESFNARETAVIDIARRWLAGDTGFSIRTSGSTGTPKTVILSRTAMDASAGATLEYFQLHPGMTVFCPLSVDYIAGMMMVVRSVVGGLKGIFAEPASDIIGYLQEVGPVDLAVMVPMQMAALLNSEEGRESLRDVRQVLLGGTSLDPSLESRIQDLAVSVYHGYGMTETCSHIAMRRVNGPGRSQSYFPMPRMNIRTDPDGFIICNGPATDGRELRTLDLARFDKDGGFHLQGRADDVINSGGHKIHPEHVESFLKPLLKDAGFDTEKFSIGSVPDGILGRKAVLMCADSSFGDKDFESLISEIRASAKIHPYEIPRALVRLEKLPRTESGKIRRKLGAEDKEIQVRPVY